MTAGLAFRDRCAEIAMGKGDRTQAEIAARIGYARQSVSRRMLSPTVRFACCFAKAYSLSEEEANELVCLAIKEEMR